MSRLLISGLFLSLWLLPLQVQSQEKSPPLPKKFDLKAIDAYVAGQLRKKGSSAFPWQL